MAAQHALDPLRLRRGDLAVTVSDRVLAWLTTMLGLASLAFLVLFVLWLTSVLKFSRATPPILLFPSPSASQDPTAGLEREPPRPTELAELREPSLQQLLEAANQVVSSQSAALDAIRGPDSLSDNGAGSSGNRRKGPDRAGPNRNVLPPWERWEIRCSTSSLGEYARQLDSLGIELAAVGGSNRVDYASRLSEERPATRTAPASEEKRLYMTWRAGKLQAWDRQLLANAGVPTDDRVVLQFFPKALEDALAALEQAHARGRPPEEWLKTIFAIQWSGESYEFYVVEQLYRRAPR